MSSTHWRQYTNNLHLNRTQIEKSVVLEYIQSSYGTLTDQKCKKKQENTEKWMCLLIHYFALNFQISVYELMFVRPSVCMNLRTYICVRAQAFG